MMIFQLKSVWLLPVIFFISPSCNQESGNPEGPTMEFYANSVSDNDSLPKEGWFPAHIIATKGSSDLEEFSIKRDGQLLNVSDIYSILNAARDIPISNPLSIPPSATDGFTYSFFINKPESGQFEYDFILRDANGLEFTERINLLFYNIPVDIELLPFNNIDTVVNKNSWFNISLLADRGTAHVDSVTIFQDGLLLSNLDRLMFEQFPISANPLALALTNVSLTLYFQILIIETGIQTYTFKVHDQDGYTAELSVTVTGI
ncbi:MAG: hypothetical protein ABIQ11_09935 [Saprospiraceae bacterium]